MKLFGIWPLAGKKESAPGKRDAIRRKRMESQLLERIYSGQVGASTPERTRHTMTIPLGYEQAFGAYARRRCEILAPDDFATDLVFWHGMDFDVFVTINHIELLEDDARGYL